MAETVREIVLARPPAGPPRPEDFALREAPLRPEEGEVLVAVEWLAMDPYLRLRIAGRHLGPAVRPGEPIPGEGLGRVLASRVPERFPVGS
ncbi:MAG: hypothetical protein NZP34_16090, partial [Caldilineales bacterium]|nr:hypothetical protein [Caldilineales bacterium]